MFPSVACSSYCVCFVQFSRCGPDLKSDSSTSLFSKILESDLNGGDKRIRTADPLLAKQVLSQLSYTPKSCSPFWGPRDSSFERYWWAQVDSNHRPHDYQSCALAS